MNNSNENINQTEQNETAPQIENEDVVLEEKVKKPSLRSKIKDVVPSLTVEAYRFSVVAFLIYALFLVVLRVITIENSVRFPGFTGGNDVYKLENTFYTKAFLIMYLLGAVAAFLIGVFSHKIVFGTNKRSNAFVFVSSLAGFCMVGCAGFFVYRMALIEAEVSKLNYWVIILMLFTGAYFAMDAVGFITKKTKPWFSVGVVIFAVLRVISEFISLHGKQYVSSNEYHIVSLTALLIFFCTNARFHVYGKTSIWYRFFGLFASLTTLIYALPEIYISLFEPYYVDSIFIFCIVDAVLAFYVLAKLLSVRKVKANLPETDGEDG